MKLGVLTVPLSGKSLKEACAYLAKLGVQTLEIGCGGSPGKAHCDPTVLLNDPEALHAFSATIADAGLELAALSVHGNGVHPDPAHAKKVNDEFLDACLLAEKLGVNTVVTFSGCPGGSPSDRTPNWVTCVWPDDFSKVREYQWNEVLIPYWKKTAALAADHGVNRIALEMHPGFSVYNPETCLQLRAAVGDAIGANFDPSHLFWQGIDPESAIRAMKGAIYHFHAKDTRIDPINSAVNGVLDTKSFGDPTRRSWMFRTVGYGHDAQCWRDIMSTLRLTGYEGAVSIEHEDMLMSIEEGLEKAIAFLKDVMMFEMPGESWWF
ncbi:MAG: sugar phosphate isomerase/epimerase [Oscillospiraceae bacterium]|jgi:sugar phosphate isomerase/epimerase|nr:sugar phosphate isomerase/epimerase [Oscillospiraceae bacterium]